jgi:outer membrane protein
VLTIKKILVALSLMLASVVSFAQGKIIAMDPEAAIFSSNVAKAKIEQFNKNPEFSAIKANAELKLAEIKNLDALAKKDGMTWSKEQKAENEKKAQTLIQDFQMQKKKLEQAEMTLRQDIVKELSPKLEAAMKQIIAAEGVTMVVSPRALVHLDPKSDYTPKLIEALNKAK